MSDPEAVREVADAWIDRARTDLATARVVLGARGELQPWVAAYHAQQAAEKSIKAALVVEQVAFPRTHDLDQLQALLPTDWSLPPRRSLASLSRFAIAGRYPEGPLDPQMEPTWAEAEEAASLAADVLDAVAEGAARRRGDADHSG